MRTLLLPQSFQIASFAFLASVSPSFADISSVIEVNLSADTPAIVEEIFEEDALAFSDRLHQHNGAAFDPATGQLSLVGETVVPLPAYLVGHPYVRFANDARENGDYSATIATNQPSRFYLLIDNRLHGPSGGQKTSTTDPVLGGTLQWVIDGGWERMNTGLSPNGQGDYTGLDEGGDGVGAGVSLNQFYSVYRYPSASQQVVVRNNGIGSTNMIAIIAAPLPEPVALYEFDTPADLGKATLGGDLTIVGTPPSYATLVADSRIEPVSLAGVITTTHGMGNHLVVPHGIGANGGGAFTNRYTLVYDVLVPGTGQWRSFYQTSPTNSNDADYFVRASDGVIGVGALTYSSTPIPPNQWHRLALSVDLGAGLFQAYLNGALFHAHSTGTGADGRFSLDPDQLILFGDEDGENHPLRIGQVAVFDRPLSAGELATLGGVGDSIGYTGLADLVVELEGPAKALIGVPFEYTITARNVGDVPASNVTIHVRPPPGMGNVFTSAVATTDGFDGSLGFPHSPLFKSAIFSGGTLAPGASATLVVTAMASSPGEFSGLGLAHIDPDSTVEESNEVNNQSAESFSTVVAAPAPKLVIEQPAGTPLLNNDSRDFGAVPVGGNANLTFTIRNIGSADLTGFDFVLFGPDSDMFAVADFPDPVVPGPDGTTTFTVAFTPTNAGLKSAQLTGLSNDPENGEFHINLIGQGVSTNAVLAALTVDSGTLSPDFSPSVTAYTLSLPHETDSFTLTPARADANASMSLYWLEADATVELPSGDGAIILSPEVGTSTYELRLTAEDGVTTNTYTVVVTRAIGVATSYNQAFDYADGTTFLGGGTILVSGAGSASVQGGTLRLTDDSVHGEFSAFKLPPITGAAEGWTASFDVTLVDADPGASPADGFSFNWGPIPLDSSHPLASELGWSPDVNHVAFRFVSYEGGGNAGLHIAGHPSGAPVVAASQPGALLNDNTTVQGRVKLSWHPVLGASLQTEGFVTNANFRNVPVSGFNGADGHVFAFAARTGGLTQTVLIDNLSIVVGTVDVPMPMTNAIGGRVELGSGNFVVGRAGTAGGVNNWPAGEPPSRAIDGDFTTGKYLNFAETYTGLIVTPTPDAAGAAVHALGIYTANDAEPRDPASYELYGSTTPISDATPGNEYAISDMVFIAGGALNLPSARNSGPALVTFPNERIFASYLLVFPAVKDPALANSMQIAEVRFFGHTPERARIETLYNTGVSGAGLPLPDNASDPHYTLVAAPDAIGVGTPLVVGIGNGFPIPPWLANSDTSNWLGTTREDALVLSGTDPFINRLYYQTSFNLAGLDPGTAEIAFNLAADDTVTSILINGIDSGIALGSVTFTGYQPITFGPAQRALLNGGLNTLTFVVPMTHNGLGVGDYAGLRVDFTERSARRVGVVSPNAELADLALSAGSLVPVFSPTTLNYEVAVPSTVTELNLTPTAAQAGATVSVNGVAVVSGTASQAIALAVGSNPVAILVTAPDGITTKTYSVTVTRAVPPPSTNANLSALACAAGALSPAFSAETTRYAITAGDTVLATTVTSTAEDADALVQVRVNGGGYAPVVSGQSSPELPLRPGTNLVEVLVTAASGDTKTYEIEILRAHAALARWDFNDSLQQGGSIASIGGYAGTFIGQATRSPDRGGVSGASGDYALDIVDAGSAMSATTAEFLEALNQQSGQQKITITYWQFPRSFSAGVAVDVVSPSSVSQRGILVRSLYWDGNAYFDTSGCCDSSTRLSTSLGVALGTWEFMSFVYDAGEKRIYHNFDLIASSSGAAPLKADFASVFVGNGSTLGEGFDALIDDITIWNGALTESEIVQLAAQGPGAEANAHLIALTPSTGALMPAFSSTTLNYEVTVPSTVTELNLTPTVAQAGTTVSVNGVAVVSGTASQAIALAVGSNPVAILVTAPDGITTKTYSVTVTRAVPPPSTNANLSALACAAGALSPAFSAETTRYAITAGETVLGTTVTSTAEDADALVQVRVNGGAYAPVVSGQSSSELPLRPGTNLVEVLVTAASGDTKTYEIEILRAHAALARWDFNDSLQQGGSIASIGGYAGTFIGQATRSPDRGGVSGASGDYALDIVDAGSAMSATTAEFLEALNQQTGQQRITITYWQFLRSTPDAFAVFATSPTSSIERGLSATSPWGDGHAYFDTSGCCNHGSTRLSGPLGATLGTWQFISLVFDDGVKSIFRNTDLIATHSSADPLKSDLISFYVGNEDGLSHGMDALIDEFTIWNGALTTSELTQLSGQAPSDEGNAYLASLVPSHGPLVPPFAATTLGYDVTVPSSMTAFSLTPTVAQTGATLSVNGVVVASGTASQTIPLAVGSNPLSVVVTAKDGTTTNTYIVTVTRAEPIVATSHPADAVTSTAAVLNGMVDPKEGAATVFFEYGSTPEYGYLTPTQRVSGNLPVLVGSALTGLAGGTVYHFRLVAIDADTTVYGGDLIFATLPSPPVVATGGAVAIDSTGATLVGAVNPNGLPVEVRFEYGLTTLYGGVTLPRSLPAGTTLVDVLTPLTELYEGATYHFRIVASTAAGTAFGQDMTFVTEDDGGTGTGSPSAPPAVTTGGVAAVTDRSVELLGSANPNGGTTVVQFEYGTTPAYGLGSAILGIGNDVEPALVSLPAHGLLPGTVYHYRLIATNSLGTTTGADSTFTTLYPAPEVVTGEASALSTVRALVRGSVRGRQAETTVFIDYGTDPTSLSNIVTATPATVSGSVEAAIDAELANLTQGITYYYQVRAESSGGTGRGTIRSFDLGILSGFFQQFPNSVGLSDRQGRVSVSLSPAGIGGGWRFAGEQPWRLSGDVVAGMATGDRVIEFRPVPGFQQPVDETVVVISGEPPVELVREYAPSGTVGTGGLVVTLKPDALADPSLPPASRAQWRLFGENDAQWRNSGDSVDALVPGDYVIECKPMAGRSTPAPVSANVGDGGITATTITYFIAGEPVGTAPVPLAFEMVATRQDLPYAYAGQINSDVGSSSGFVVRPRVVATAGHVVFDDGTLAATTGLQWLFQRDRGVHEPTPQLPRGFYLMTGYAAQRAADNSPGTSSPESQNLDAAALYFLADAGRGGYGGYLASDSLVNEFLISPAIKTLVGYPVEDIPPSEQGRLHATPPADVTFAPAFGQTYTTSAVRGSGGNSGGPLCVRYGSGVYYPAAIYLGGTAQTVVRAIDGDVVDLIGFAEASATAAVGSTGGGITETATRAIGTPGVGALKVLLEPAGARMAGAGWRIQAQAPYLPSGAQVDGINPNTYTVQLATVSGFVPPAPQTLTIEGGQLATITFTYEEIIPAPVITSPLTVVGTRAQPLDYQITALNSPQFFSLFGILPAGLSFDAATGLIAGEPLESGNFVVVVGATNSGGSDTRSVTVSSRPILPTQNATVPYERPMSYGIVSSESGAGVTYTASNLPDGLSLEADTGLVSGIPTTPGVFDIPITVAKKGALSASTLTLFVTGTVPVIGQQPPATRIIEFGQSTVLTVQADGLPAPSFQWYLGSSGVTTNPVAGANAPTFSTPPMTAGASYWVRISSISGSVDSSASIIALLPSTNPALAKLGVSDGVLNPAFSPGVTAYTLVVPYAVSSLVISPEALISQSSLTVDDQSVASGETSDPVALDVGPNEIPIEVTAGDGSTTRTYTLAVTRSMPPLATTGEAMEITDVAATLHGEVLPNGPVTVMFQYGRTESYGDTTLTQTLTGNSPVPAITRIAGLNGDTEYHYRIVVIAGTEVFFGEDRTFTTNLERPLAATGNPAGVSPTGAALMGAVNPKGLLTAVQFEYGLTAAYGSLTPMQSLPAGFSVVDVLAQVSGLTAGATYHYRIVATSAAGTSYGQDVSFPAISGGGTGDGVVDAPPTVTTGGVSDVTTASAVLLGTVNPREGTTFVHFEYGLTPAYGSRTASEGVGNGNEPVNVTLGVPELLPGTAFHYRLVATNSLGTAEGSDRTFTTGFFAPKAVTGAAEALSPSTARVFGMVNASGTTAEVFFDFGTDGISFPDSIRAIQTTVAGDRETEVHADLTNLKGLSTYYYRLRANSPGGAGLGAAKPLMVGALLGFRQAAVSTVAAGEYDGQAIVTLRPGGIGGWRILGEPVWRASGSSATGLTTGNWEIEFQPVAGHIQPPRQFIGVISGESPTVHEGFYHEAAEPGSATLKVVLKPNSLAGDGVPVGARAQWRLVGGDSAWLNSGDELTALVDGSYIVECKVVPGWNPPSASTVIVDREAATTATLTYVASTGPIFTPPVVLGFDSVSSALSTPYAYVGQVRSNAGLHSGFVVKPRVVATAGQAVFDDATLSTATSLQWLLQRDRGSYEPTPRVPRGIYVFDGYASRRAMEDSPGMLSIESQNLNVAALYFSEDAGRGGFSGFLASEEQENEFLQSSALKSLVGYPVSGVSPANQGRMHATPLAEDPLTWVFGRTFTSAAIRGLGGMTGGPLCVQYRLGAYYPAGIYVGGSTRGAIRAIDGSVIDLFSRAEVSANGGDNNTGGGITHSSVAPLGSGDQGAVEVTILPAAAATGGARWELKSESPTRRSDTRKAGISPGNYTLWLNTIPGFQAPAQETVRVIGGKLTKVTYTYAAALSPIESWRRTYFGATTNSGPAANTADPEFDGLTNLMEFTFGLNPTRADSAQLPEWQRIGSSYRLSFERPSGVSGITYFAEQNFDLDASRWIEIPNTGTAAQPVFEVPDDGAAQKFLRYGVRSP